MSKEEEIIKAESDLMQKHRIKNDKYVCNKGLLLKLIIKHTKLLRYWVIKGIERRKNENNQDPR